MHFLLLGGSGRTGKLVIGEILSRGNTVTALVRNTASLEPRKGLIVVQGTPLDIDDVDKAFKASTPVVPDAGIMTIASVRESDSPFAKQVSPPRLLADSSKNLVEVLKKNNVKRVVIMSTMGVGDSWASLPILSKLVMGYSNIKYTLEDHNLLDTEIRGSGMDFTLVRPTRLEYDEKVKMVKTYGSDGKGHGMMSSMTTGTAANFLAQVAEGKEWVCEAIAISN
jgi:nucleoside-diphosphate-sugar epimerase